MRVGLGPSVKLGGVEVQTDLIELGGPVAQMETERLVEE